MKSFCLRAAPLVIPLAILAGVAAILHYVLGVPHEVSGLSVAAVVQSAYSENIAAAYAGMIADMSKAKIDSRVVETAAGLDFGIAVSQGSNDNGCLIGAAAATDFVGITVRDVTLPSSQSDKYAEYDTAGILTDGDIWVTTGGAVNAGDDVTFAATTGVLSSAATSGSQFAIAGARWMTSAGSGELAKLRLSGSLPSA